MGEFDYLLKKYERVLSFAGRRAFIAKAALRGLTDDPARLDASRHFFERAGLLDALDLLGEGVYSVSLKDAALGAFSKCRKKSDLCESCLELAQDYEDDGKIKGAKILYRRALEWAEAAGEFDVARMAAKSLNDSREEMYSTLDFFLSSPSNSPQEYLSW